MTYSTKVEQNTLDAWLGGTALTLPGTVWVGLSTTTISNSAAPTEPGAGSYARVSVTNNATQWPAATGNTPASKKNANVITFPVSTASWGTVTDAFIADAVTAGNVLFFGALTSSVNVNAAGFTLSFAGNALTITLN